jgi:hypothetical protein
MRSPRTGNHLTALQTRTHFYFFPFAPLSRKKPQSLQARSGAPKNACAPTVTDGNRITTHDAKTASPL